jgi:hypothetical protein
MHKGKVEDRENLWETVVIAMDDEMSDMRKFTP